jgi:hypothetical protein
MIDFKISAHATSQIMTEGKGKSKAEKLADLETEIAAENVKLSELKESSKSWLNKLEKVSRLNNELNELKAQPEKIELSQTCITYLENWVKEQIYGYKFEFDSDQTLKGITVEDDAIQYAASALGWGMGIKKNQLRFSSEFMQGTPDLIIDDLVIDIKCPESPRTLPLFTKELPTRAYYWQLQTYMYLTGKAKAQVTYVMMPTPDEILKKVAFFKAKNIVGTENKIEFDAEFDTIFARLQYENDFSNIDPKHRIVCFDIERNDSDINAIIERVKQCRQYIEQHLTV